MLFIDFRHCRGKLFKSLWIGRRFASSCFSHSLRKALCFRITDTASVIIRRALFNVTLMCFVCTLTRQEHRTLLHHSCQFPQKNDPWFHFGYCTPAILFVCQSPVQRDAQVFREIWCINYSLSFAENVDWFSRKSLISLHPYDEKIFIFFSRKIFVEIHPLPCQTLSRESENHPLTLHTLWTATNMSCLIKLNITHLPEFIMLSDLQSGVALINTGEYKNFNIYWTEMDINSTEIMQ